MNKRDWVRIVFRIAAIIIIFFYLLHGMSSAVHALMILGQYMQNISGMIEIIIAELILPFVLAILFWNKGEWIAEKILGRFQNSNPSETNNSNVDEIESIIMTAIGITIIVFSIPEILDMFRVINVSRNWYYYFDAIVRVVVIPISKLTIGVWLILRSKKRWRTTKMMN